MYQEFCPHKNSKLIFDSNELDHYQIQLLIDLISSQLDLTLKGTVAIIMPRNKYLIPSMLACLKLGKPYIPIDPSYPKERIQFMLTDSKACFVITEEKFKESFIHPNIILIDSISESSNSNNLLNNNYGKNDIAYILYTSGSTGQPKGVEIYQKSLINFILGIQKIVKFKTTDHIACITTPTFDIFFLESIMALSIGMTVFLANDSIVDNPKTLSKWLIDNKINVLQITPSRLQQLYYIDKIFSCLKYMDTILVGGEAFPIHLLEKLQKYTNAKIFNMYGPTETTIWSSIADLTNSKTVHIGQPINNTEFHILSDDLNEVSTGEIGEICISGDGLAKGYLNRPDLTEKAFVYFNNQRLYKTGDFGTLLENNNYGCYGRKDNQIKIRGHRIELEEIEHAICLYKGIHYSAVVFDKFESASLYVYYVADTNIDTAKLKKFLGSILPNYMIPSFYTKIDQIPVTKNGKINRNELINKICNSKELDINIIEHDDITKKVVNIVNDVIKPKTNTEIDINTKSSLSDLGIDSISFIRIIVAIEEAFNFEFDDDMLLITVFQTINDFVVYVNKKVKSEDSENAIHS